MNILPIICVKLRFALTVKKKIISKEICKLQSKMYIKCCLHFCMIMLIMEIKNKLFKNIVTSCST